VWAYQEALRARLASGDEDAARVLFLEHDPIITLGRTACARNVLAPEADLARLGVSVLRSSRGGDVTVHGPGQLVMYPVVRVSLGIVAHMEWIAGALVGELGALGIRGAEWRRDQAGVWVGDAKIAACGVHVRRRVAIHGFALNVTRSALAPFAWIVPCGLVSGRVTSVESELGEGTPVPSLPMLAESIADRLARELGRRAVWVPSDFPRETSIVTCDQSPAR
jgi:lipoyl(octanoyl) transferase